MFQITVIYKWDASSSICVLIEPYVHLNFVIILASSNITSETNYFLFGQKYFRISSKKSLSCGKVGCLKSIFL